MHYLPHLIDSLIDYPHVDDWFSSIFDTLHVFRVTRAKWTVLLLALTAKPSSQDPTTEQYGEGMSAAGAHLLIISLVPPLLLPF